MLIIAFALPDFANAQDGIPGFVGAIARTPYYNTVWFRVAALAVFVLLLLALYQIRLITRHNAQLLRENIERKRAEALVTGEKRLLEMIATGAPLASILDVLCRVIEEQRSGTLASVLLLRPDGQHLDSVAGPSLPKEWTQQMASLPIGPCAGSCGTAAFRGSAVIVSDLATDPLWDVPEHRASALRHGLRASWSNPVLSSEGKVLGTFCMYYREPRSPNSHDLELIELATHLARVAIERDRAEEALRRSEGFLADGQRTVTPAPGAGIPRPGKSSGRRNTSGSLDSIRKRPSHLSNYFWKRSIRGNDYLLSEVSRMPFAKRAALTWSFESRWQTDRLRMSRAWAARS